MADFELQAEKSGSYKVDTFLLIQISFGMINVYQSKKKICKKMGGTLNQLELNSANCKTIWL